MSGELLVIQIEGLAGANPKKVIKNFVLQVGRIAGKVPTIFSRIINAPSGSFFLLGTLGNSLSNVVTRGG
jgi:hypothetical protein